MLDKLTSDDFQPYLNQTFRITVNETDVRPAELIQVATHGSAEENRRSPFSIVFRIAGNYLPQQIYRFEQENLGTLDIFIVPIGEDNESFRYEAVFN